MRKLLLMLILVPLSAGCMLTEANRKKASYHYQMGESHLREQNMTLALVEYTEAEKYIPDDPDLQYFLGIVYFNKGKFEIAEQKFLKAIVERPSFSDARNHLGVNYMEMQRWDDAITQLQIVNDDIFYQRQEDAVINLALAYLGKGNYEKALQIMKAAVISHPRNPRARLTLGRAYFSLDKLDLAIEEYLKTIDLSKGYANAHYFLGLAYLKSNKIDAAKLSFQEVVLLAPDSNIGRQSREHLDLLK